MFICFEQGQPQSMTKKSVTEKNKTKGTKKGAGRHNERRSLQDEGTKPQQEKARCREDWAHEAFPRPLRLPNSGVDVPVLTLSKGLQTNVAHLSRG